MGTATSWAHSAAEGLPVWPAALGSRVRSSGDGRSSLPSDSRGSLDPDETGAGNLRGPKSEASNGRLFI